MRALAFLALLAGPAAATEDGWPALHDVVDVAADDILNVRSEPNGRSEIIGTLKPDAVSVEVVGTAPENDGWGVVNVGERAGYVSLRFLLRHRNTYVGSELPIKTCFGTEPFWSIERADGRLAFQSQNSDIDWAIPEAPMLTNVEDRDVQVRTARSATMALTLYTRLARSPYFCGDGMSDRSFGIHASLLVEGPDGTQLFSGCCSLSD